MTKMSSILFTRNTEFKKRKKRNTVDLPEELVVEILSRVQAASLARFRSISKGCNALIKDLRFAKNHSANAPRQSLIITLVDFRVSLVSFDLNGIHNKVAPSAKVTSQLSLKDPLSNPLEEQVDIRNVFHCDGLLLYTTKDNRLVAWNPCSGETSWIQPRNSYKKSDCYALGRSSCNKYKILRLDNHRMNPLVEYEIYDFSYNSWRGVGETNDWYIPVFWRCGMSVNGNTYWLASSYSNNNSASVDIIISFDFSTERFGSVPLPGDQLSYNAFALIVTREEHKLCLIALRGSEIYDIDVWMTTEIDQSTGAASWSKLLTVERDLYRHYFRFRNGMDFFFDQENKVLVCGGNHGYSNSLLHILGQDKYIPVDHHEVGSKLSLLVSYVLTLVQIQRERSLGVGTSEAPNT